MRRILAIWVLIPALLASCSQEQESLKSENQTWSKIEINNVDKAIWKEQETDIESSIESSFSWNSDSEKSTLLEWKKRLKSESKKTDKKDKKWNDNEALLNIKEKDEEKDGSDFNEQKPISDWMIWEIKKAYEQNNFTYALKLSDEFISKYPNNTEVLKIRYFIYYITWKTQESAQELIKIKKIIWTDNIDKNTACDWLAVMKLLSNSKTLSNEENQDLLDFQKRCQQNS